VSIRQKAVLLLLIAAIVILVSFLATRGSHAATPISTTHAVRRDFSSWIASNGKVEPVKQQIIQAKLTTFVDRVLVIEGQTVSAGQVLMTLDARDFETQLAHMREQLAASQEDGKIAAGGGDPDVLAELQTGLSKNAAEIAQLRREGDTLERLHARQAATQQEIDQNKNALARAEVDGRLLQEKLQDAKKRAAVQGQLARLRVQESEASIQALENKISSASVRVSEGGTVYALPARPGIFVHEGDVVAELADLTRIQVRVYVDEPDLGLLREGQTVEVTWDGSPSDTWCGVVRQLPKRVVARGSRTVGEVICSVEGSNSKLLPNTDIYARIRTAERDNSLSVSRNAVRTEGNKHYVFVVDRGHIHKQEIGIGISNSTDFEVLSGITENDLIALPGSSDLHDGSAVNIGG
jgi:HlyD family secretion protein